MIAGALSVPEAVVLGIVEGLTEFLPVSSTGHLLFVEELLGLGANGNSSAADTFAVVVQFGAILAALVLFRARIASMLRGMAGRDADGARLARSMVVAFLPAAVVGVLAGDAIKDALFGPVPVAVAWAVGGLVLLAWRPFGGGAALETLGVRRAAIIGAAQVLAMWPGVSRSLATIVAAMFLGLSLAAAVEFSFLLGLVTLSAATAFDLLDNGGTLLDRFGIVAPLVGLVAAFVSAVVAVRWVLGHLTEATLRGFGWYRLAVALAAAGLLLTGAV